MPSEFAFRLSTYLTLALSCLCLGYAEYDLLPESMFITGGVLVSLGFSFWADGRYLLDLKAANRVGLVIGLLVGGWMTYQFVNENSLIYRISWPAGLLPFLGPLLMILMPAKLFRPKHVGDWWAMQGIALAGVSLASAMSEDEIFGILLALYAVSGVTSLVLFYYRRTANTLPPVPNTDAGPAVEIVADATQVSSANGRAITRRVVGWLAISFLVALPLFFVTPRSQSVPMKMRGGKFETGFGADQTVDLTRTGTLEINREVAYEVRATYLDGRPKDDISPNQRWRGVSFTQYDGGKWGRGDTPQLIASGVTPLQALFATDIHSPDFGPDRVALDFSPRTRSFEPVLADPVFWEIGKPSPVTSRHISGDARPWWQSPDASIRPIGVGPGRAYQYRQLTRIPPGPDPDLSPAFELSAPTGPAFLDLVAGYRSTRLAKLRTWSRELLVRLAKTNPRLAGVMGRASDRVNFEVASEDYEVVGRAFCDHLKSSGEYEYTLNLRRTDKNLDPVEDFLMKTKSGHCERYATALVLMLRSVGIPAVYILGFKGCEPNGDGVYTIRQEHAHGWVEILIPRPAPPGFPFVSTPLGVVPQPKTTVWHWLSLDPTPDGGPEEASTSLTDWLGTAKQNSVAFFLDFIVGYNTERRNRTVETITDWLLNNALRLLLIPAAFVGLAFARRARRRHLAKAHSTGTLADTATGVVWFDEYLAVLKRYGIRLPLGATPAEFAVAVAGSLRSRPGCAGVVEIPLDITRAFYLVRYAKQWPGETERARLADAVLRLAGVLRANR